MKTNPRDYFKTKRDYYIFVLLYTVGTVRDELLNIASIVDSSKWYQYVKQQLFPIKSEDELRALDILTEIYQELVNSSKSVAENELVKFVLENKPKKRAKDSFIVLESGVDFSNKNMYLEEKVFIAFPANSRRLEKLKHYCVDRCNHLFYSLGYDESYKPFNFEDIKAETGYWPTLSNDKITACTMFLKENKLVEGVI